MTESKSKKNKRKLSKELVDLAACLTAEELHFCELVFEGITPIEALIESGIEEKRDKATAERYMSRGVINSYIDALRRQVARRSVLSLEKIQERMSDIALTNQTDVIDIGPTEVDMKTGLPVTTISLKDAAQLTEGQLAAIKSIEPTQGGLKITLYDRVKIMESLAKMQGAYTEKREVTHNAGSGAQVFAFLGSNGRGPENS